MPETVVKIRYDEPKDKHWLCADNIKIALSAYCTNTKFEVEEILTKYEEDLDGFIKNE